MQPVPKRFRWRKILRQYLPGNPAQIVPLLAAICLSACFARSWVLVGPATVELQSQHELREWASLTLAFVFPLLLAGVGAYFCCLWPQENAAKGWLLLAVVPAFVGIAGSLMGPGFIVVNTRPQSVLERYNHVARSIQFPGQLIYRSLGTGFQLAALGLFLALVSWWMLERGIVALPLRFGPEKETTYREREKGTNARLRIFSLYALCLYTFVGTLLYLPFSAFFDLLLNRLASHSSGAGLAESLFAAQTFVYTLPLFALAAWALGEERRKRLAEAARFPSAWLLALAIALPVAAFWVPHLIAYAIDRISWAQHWSEMPEAPVAARYLHLPFLESGLLTYAFAAALTEWAWRGCIQPQFIRLFGISRGIFLVGLLYGSLQFLYFPLLDIFRVFGGLAHYFIGFLLQLLWGVVWSTVFGWLTLRARSVWPAVVSAALISVIAQASQMDSIEMIPYQFIRLCLLGSGFVIAILLVRYLPLKSEPPGPSLAGTPTVSESIS